MASTAQQLFDTYMEEAKKKVGEEKEKHEKAHGAARVEYQGKLGEYDTKADMKEYLVQSVVDVVLGYRNKVENKDLDDRKLKRQVSDILDKYMDQKGVELDELFRMHAGDFLDEILKYEKESIGLAAEDVYNKHFPEGKIGEMNDERKGTIELIGQDLYPEKGYASSTVAKYMAPDPHKKKLISHAIRKT